MSEINYCANGCTRREGDTQRRITTEGPSQLCTRCETRLHDWIKNIPDTYALLPRFVMPGSTEPDPDKRAAKITDAPAPMRLDVIDLLDERLGRKWLGTEVTQDRRGVLGTLWAWVNLIADERPLTNLPTPNVTTACQLLERHLLWAAEQTWISDLYDEIKTLRRTLADATGDYRKKPVGHCHVVPEHAEQPCGGPLFASTYGGVTCARCHATWDANHLRQLGLAQAAATETA